MFDDPQALIFACDGTRVDSLYVHEIAGTEVLNRYQIPFTAERMNQFGGVPTAETIAILAHDAGILAADATPHPLSPWASHDSRPQGPGNRCLRVLPGRPGNIRSEDPGLVGGGRP